MSVINPNLCKRVALRYSLAMIGLCTLAPILDITSWTFAADSLPFNLYLSYLAFRFYQKGDSKSSRALFRFTLVHIPAILILMLLSKVSRDKTAEQTKVVMETETVSGIETVETRVVSGANSATGSNVVIKSRKTMTDVETSTVPPTERTSG